MTTLLSGHNPSLFGHNLFDDMDQNQDSWNNPHYQHNTPFSWTTLPHGIPTQPITDLDTSNRSWQQHTTADNSLYSPMNSGFNPSVLSGYHPEHPWTPTDEHDLQSTASGFLNEPLPAYRDAQGSRSTTSNNLQPYLPDQSPMSTHSYPNSHIGLSPGGLSPSDLMAAAKRPVSDHLLPANNQASTVSSSQNLRTRKSTVTNKTDLKRPAEEDADEEFVPGEDTKTTGGRGRKRQRIPHTAVERRYRENLNAHLDRLRQAVPSLARRVQGRHDSMADAVPENCKPSKCEVLSGAIEHIGELDRERQQLRARVQELEEDLARWYQSGRPS